MKIISLLIPVCVCLNACASVSRSIPIKLDPLNPPVVSDAGFAQDHAALVAYLKKNPDDRDHVSDVMLILDAMTAEKRGEMDGALAAWYGAISKARGPFGEKAFNGWLRVYARKFGKKLGRLELAQNVLAETKSGSVSPWMIERGLQSEAKIIPILQREVPDVLAEDPSVSEDRLDAPVNFGISSSDPLMTQLASDVCKYKSKYGNGWASWRKALNPDVLKYFEALVTQCSGQSVAALAVYTEIVPRLAASPATVQLALETYARMIRIRRDQGERESVAPLYLPFMELWKNPGITEATLGMSRVAFEQRRIEDTLWAARARATIGDGEAAKNFADDVLNYVASALAQSFMLTPEQKNNLAAAAAETYHLLAFRLAVESKDWNKAFNISELALEQPYLPEEWRFRLQWSQGIYRYMGGDFDQARKIWETLLTDSSDERMRPSLLFWASQAHAKLGNQTEASFYRKSLAQDFPLSFYSVVALKQTQGGFENHWTERFKDIPGLRKSLQNWHKMDIDDLRSDRDRGGLLRRAEIFASLGMTQFAGYALDEVQKSFNPQSGSEREAAWGLYVSRLSAAAGNWLGAISMTTKLSKDPAFWGDHPEQMLVYFPRPYLSSYKAISDEFKINSSVLLGVSRQESSFRADVKSGANAWGLMQLLPATARRLVPVSGFSDAASVQIPESLLKPDVNTRIAAAFIRELSGRFPQGPAQVYAAYNAGAQAVDGWVARRLFDDALIFIEMIPYSETRDYVKGVWRNEVVYDYLAKTAPDLLNK